MRQKTLVQEKMVNMSRVKLRHEEATIVRRELEQIVELVDVRRRLAFRRGSVGPCEWQASVPHPAAAQNPNKPSQQFSKVEKVISGTTVKFWRLHRE